MPRCWLIAITLNACTSTDSPDEPHTDAGVHTDTDSTDVDTDTPIDPLAPTWQLDDPVTCTDPELRDTTPFVPFDGGSDWATRPFNANSPSLFVGGGLSVADFSGDGRLDLMLTSYTTVVQYWVQGDDLTMLPAADRLPALPERSSGITAVDVDDDGDLDALLTVFLSPDVLLINDGTGTFSDGTAAAGIAGPDNGRTMSSSWADVDDDGDLDAFVARYGRLSTPQGLPDGQPSSLFRNDGGVFTEIGEQSFPDPLDDRANPIRIGHTFMGAFTDVDLNGQPDLYVVNDFGWVVPSLLMRREGSTFVWDATTGAQLGRENMGLGIGDLNHDGLPDFLVTAWDDLGLFLSDAHTGTWFESSQSLGLRPDWTRDQRVAWGNQLGDLDNDGDLDAVISYGHLPVDSNNVNPDDQPDAVFLQGDDGTFTDVAPAWGLDHLGRSRGVLLVDLDRNGFLDLITADLRGPLRVHLATCNLSAWLGISLQQPAPNRNAIGARVVVTVGDTQFSDELRAGGTGYGTSGPPELHFGLGDVDRVDTIEVFWPDGRVDAMHDVDTRRWVRVVRP